MIDEDFFLDLIDKHIFCHNGFAIYRLPDESLIHLVIQHNGNCLTPRDLLDVDNYNGFLMAPFSIDNEPVIIVKDEYTAIGIENITNMLIHLPANEHYDSQYLTSPRNISRDEYSTAFHYFLENLKNNEASKLVLARSVSRQFPYSPSRYFFDKAKNNIHQMVYLCFTPQSGLWIGCTPEIIIEGHHNSWHTIALAGTQIYSDNLIWNDKNILEQHIVAQYINNVLKPISSNIKCSETYTAKAGLLAHLRTDINFDTNESIGVGEILNILHPTPAVCGFPIDFAKKIINKYEPTKRFYYSGIVGPLNIDEYCHLYVNLRCARIDNDIATCFAGGGLLASSVENEEWNETEMKISTIID